MIRPFAKPALLLVLALAPAGCGGGTTAVTDPSKLPPVSEQEQKEVRKQDDAIASEEQANPVMPTKGRAAKR